MTINAKANAKANAYTCNDCKDIGSILAIVDAEGREIWKRCDCITRAINKSRLQFAKVPIELRNHKINTFDISLYQTDEGKSLAAQAKRIAANYVKDFAKYQGMGKGLYLYNKKPGSGKTRLAVSIGNALWERYGVSVGFMTVIGLLDKIKSTWSQKDNATETLINTICNADIFIFDDIGTERPTPWVEEVLFQIINTRKTSLKPTIFTSNCEAEFLGYQEKLVQRISNMAIPVPFPDESVREMMTMAENGRLYGELLGEV